MGKGRNPQSQITVLKAIVQATGDSLGARVSETLGYQKRQGKGQKEISICQHSLYTSGTRTHTYFCIHDMCYIPGMYTIVSSFGGDMDEVLNSNQEKQHAVSTKP